MGYRLDAASTTFSSSTDGWTRSPSIRRQISPDQVASHYLLASHIAVPTSVGLQLFASDPDNDAITFSAAGLPHGLSLNAQTGLISGSCRVRCRYPHRYGNGDRRQPQ